MRRNLELANLAHLHAKAALVPTSDDSTDTRLVRKCLLARVSGVPELLASGLATRVDRRRLPLLDASALALPLNFVRGIKACDLVVEHHLEGRCTGAARGYEAEQEK